MRLLKSALLGVGVMLACFVPPIVHFVSGPLSPAIGGFVVGVRARCELRRAAAIGALMGVLVLAIAGGVAAVASALLPGLLPGANLVVAALGVLGAYLYVFWLAMLGAWAGGAFARRSEAGGQTPARADSVATPPASDEAERAGAGRTPSDGQPG